MKRRKRVSKPKGKTIRFTLNDVKLVFRESEIERIFELYKYATDVQELSKCVGAAITAFLKEKRDHELTNIQATFIINRALMLVMSEVSANQVYFKLVKRAEQEKEK